jgi:poly-gamma-glutamate synthesis protein (capsule biosynthesis protein)
MNPPTLSPTPQRTVRRQPAGWCRLLTLALVIPGATALAGAPHAVECVVNYGGEDRLITAAPTAEPLKASTTAIGSYFLFRVVNTLADTGGLLKVTTYADHDSGPAPVHHASYTAGQVQAAATSKGWGFTGLQQVYEPLRDGELTYWCRLAGAQPAAPSGLPTALAPQPPQPPHPALSASAPLGTPGTLRLLMAGDVMLDDGPGRTLAQGGESLSAFASRLQQADYTLGNLEVPIARIGQPLASKIFNFRADPATTRVLKGRFQVMALANNHSGDYGPSALLETMAHLDAAGIAHLGAGANLTEAHRPLWVERNGLRVAVLSYNEFKPRSFQAGPHWPGVAWSEDDVVIADIRAARKAGADVVIPFMHWGWEREPQPTERQRQLARLMIDAGADVVVGGHPHVTQGIETYQGKLIVYSLGNFVFDGFEDVPGGQTGWLLGLTLDRHGLLAWDTQVAHMDAAGTPHPVPGTASPCGVREGRGPQAQVTLGTCANP